ncbi:putative RNA-directed DNA polymerase from transposon X-element [Trichonephila clavipes]|nr:putative RNA-directed DNA polymerase from transposon X-element [Trichonephila clavipes]
MDIDILKAKRKSLRAAFSMCCNGISNRTEALSKNEVNALYKQLQDKFSRLETIQEEISDLLLTSHDLKDTYQEDFSKAEEYRDKFCQIFSILEASQEQEILVSEENNSVQKRKFKLPKLELRKFSGEPRKTILRFGRNSRKFTWMQRLQKKTNSILVAVPSSRF